MHNPRVCSLSPGYLVTDINQGALPSLLPFLTQEYGLTYMAPVALVFAANAASSLIQSVFGHFAGPLTMPVLMPIGIFLAGTGLACMRWSPPLSARN